MLKGEIFMYVIYGFTENGINVIKKTTVNKDILPYIGQENYVIYYIEEKER